MKIYLIIIVLFFSMGSCKNFIEIDPPNDKLITKTVFAKNETAINALTGIYSRMNNEGQLPYKISQYTGIYSDELTNFSSAENLVQAYTNDLNQNQGTEPNFWKILYNHIYQANAVKEGCEMSNSLNENIKKHLIAEAIFIRSFWYFYLTNMYGDVPLILNTDYLSNSTKAKSTQVDLYNQLIEDLLLVESDLGINYVSLNTLTSSQERVRPNKYAASALLSRIYLYSKNYAKALEKSTEIINTKALYEMGSIDDAFLIKSKEPIWQIMMPSPGANKDTYEGLNYILTSKPSSGPNINNTLSPNLLQSFETGDLRRLKWVNTYIIDSTHYVYPYKYKIKNSTNIAMEYTTPFRLGEQYLIRAEAAANLNNLSQAIADIDVIRARANLPKIADTKPNMTKTELLDVILHERQIELFAEWGHRWFDLKRSGKVNEIMSIVAISKNGKWSTYKSLWPIPVREISTNSNIKQNEGYK